MSDDLIPTMLEILAHRRVPKRATLVALVAHHARDEACMAFYNDEQVPETLARIATWLPLARAAGDAALTDYLTRLAGYAAPQKVDRRAAAQRLIDLGRCAAPSRDAIDLRDVPGGFEGLIIHSAGDRRFRIDAATGAITRSRR